MKKKWLITCLILLLILNALIVYVTLPTLSIHNIGLWFIILLDVLAVSLLVYGYAYNKPNGKKTLKITATINIALVLAILIGSLISSQMINAKAYSKILNIETVEHVELPGVDKLNKIPLMDTESSKVLGNRKIGALNEIVSQFEVSEDYMTIAYKDAPVKVSPLKYAGFWKWNANRKNGVPGYVMVEPNKLTAEYIETGEGMKYVPSAFLSEDLARHIFFKYPTVFFDDIHFEIDENGKPYYVATTFDYTIGLFGGKKVTGAIVVDPVSGETNRYGVNDLPQWVDVVYNGNYIAKYFDIYGKLINGFWNSLFGQKGLIESTTTTLYDSEGESYRTNDFGYIVENNDVLVYTGVTAVTNDESNIGYLMANERTGEVKVSYFESTDEDSVMRAAEGEVQEKGYRASFPSLININGTPAYVMVLKDNLGLVKMYAIVDAAQYSHMIVDDSLDKALSTFTKGNVITGDMAEKTITIKRVELITNDGNTLVYIVDVDNNIYYSEFKAEMLLLEEGQTVTIKTDGATFLLND
ncbi:MAG: hypothetical protein IJ115_02680 [Erysipelotrichaceae bacterium]|nr:hypothetical protein [Erysipelotrichaceae bacterium]